MSFALPFSWTSRREAAKDGSESPENDPGAVVCTNGTV